MRFQPDASDTWKPVAGNADPVPVFRPVLREVFNVVPAPQLPSDGAKPPPGQVTLADEGGMAAAIV
jgi:hypothetical protein